MNVQDAERLGVLSLARITIRFNGVEQAAIVHSSTELMQPGCIGVCRKVWTGLGLKEGLDVEVEIATFPDSLYFIRNKLNGRKLAYDEILEIVEDTVKEKLSDVEISAFVTALHSFGLDLDEATNLSMAMFKTGSSMKLDREVASTSTPLEGCPETRRLCWWFRLLRPAG